MQSHYFKPEQKYQRFLRFLNLPDKLMSFEDRNELINLFAGAYEENKLLLSAGFPELSEETLDELIMRILSDSCLKKSRQLKKQQLTALAKAAIDEFSKN